MTDLIVIGGGAAGMAAAIAAAGCGDRVLVLERMDRIGKKLLATGNGRCNLLNRGEARYHGSRLAESVMNRMGYAAQVRFWQAMGLSLREETEGRVYPSSAQASTVLDVLRFQMDRFHVRVRTGEAVQGIRRGKTGLEVVTKAGVETAPHVLISCGGCAQPKLGSDGSLAALIVEGEERLPCQAAFFGIGHSARDTYRMLFSRGLKMEAKPFAMGVRIEHPQEFIDRAQYGIDAGHPRLPVADYALTYKDPVTGRGAYSFCMCPGGLVVAATSEHEGVVTNGMSNFARDSGIANSALLVQVGPEDFGREVLSGMQMQEKLEHLAFELGGRDYRAPVQTVGDFLSGTAGSEAFLTSPTYRPGVRAADLHGCLPDFISRTLAGALPFFDRKIPGFADPGVVMTGLESRSSAPCRIVRQRESMMAEATPGLYPIGEGAGYAGGIMSAAVDGMKSALAFLGSHVAY